MEVYFNEKYLAELYSKGYGGKKHRYQPNIIRKYIQIVDLLIEMPNISFLGSYKSLNYEKLKGDKKGLSSLRINDQYRLEFEEHLKDGEIVASIVNIIDLSNHYK